MPKFYINFRNRDQIAKDPEGTELPSLEAAKELGIRSARELLADKVKAGLRNPLEAVIITDESGRELLSIPATDILGMSSRA